MGHILIIDDEPQIRRMLRNWCEAEGYEVVEASDGREGIQSFRKHLSDVIITDIVMPNTEGVETIVTLKKEFPDVKIIAISAGGQFQHQGYLELARLFGADHAFEKPFTKQDLMAAVRQLMP